jgi:F0F1-type ATP synthase assembly protein I
MALAIAVVSELSITAILGGGAGYWLDSSLGTTPGLTLSFSILALVFGFKKLISRLNQLSSSDDNEPPDSGSD